MLIAGVFFLFIPAVFLIGASLLGARECHDPVRLPCLSGVLNE
jgi:hypothetical protein